MSIFLPKQEAAMKSAKKFSDLTKARNAAIRSIYAVPVLFDGKNYVVPQDDDAARVLVKAGFEVAAFGDLLAR